MDPLGGLSKNITVGACALALSGSRLSGGVRGAENHCPAPGFRGRGQESL